MQEAQELELFLDLHASGHKKAASTERFKHLALAIIATFLPGSIPICEFVFYDNELRRLVIIIIGALYAFVVALARLLGNQDRSDKHSAACVAYTTMHKHIQVQIGFPRQLLLDFPQIHKECVNKITEINAKTPPLSATISTHITNSLDANRRINEQKIEDDLKQQRNEKEDNTPMNVQKFEEELKQQRNEKEAFRKQNDNLVEEMDKQREALKEWQTRVQKLEELHEQLKEQQTQNQKLKKLYESNEQQKTHEELLEEGDRGGGSPAKQGTVEATQRGQMLRRRR